MAGTVTVIVELRRLFKEIGWRIVWPGPITLLEIVHNTGFPSVG